MINNDEHIEKKKEGLEEELNALSSKSKKYYILGAIFAIIAVINIIAELLIVGIIAFVIGVILLIFGIGASSKAKELITGDIVEEMLAKAFEIEEYNKRSHIKRQTIDDSALFPEWSNDEILYTHGDEYKYGSGVIHGSDYIKAKYKGIPFEFSDLSLIKTKIVKDEDDGTNKEEKVTLFSGQWLVVSTEKMIVNSVYVKEREKRFIGGYEKTKSNVETENIEFNERFQIITEDPNTAFLVLTPNFMEHIISTDKQANGQIYLCFSGDNLQIAVRNNRNLFESKSKDTKEISNRVESEIKYITGMLDELFQNDYLFKKPLK